MINSATYKPLTRVSSKENEKMHRKSLNTQKKENIVT